MDGLPQKKAFCSKSGIIIVTACVGILLYSIRNITATYKRVAALESRKYESSPMSLFTEIKGERGENLVLSDSICFKMKRPTEKTDVKAYPGIKINGVIALIEGDPELISGYKKIVFHLGTNNLVSRDPFTKLLNYSEYSADSIKQLYRQLCDKIHSVNPNCTILVSAILPRPCDHNITWSRIAEINSFLEATFSHHFIPSHCHFIVNSDVDKNYNVTILEEYYHPDGLHLVEKGRDRLAEVFRKSLVG